MPLSASGRNHGWNESQPQWQKARSRTSSELLAILANLATTDRLDRLLERAGAALDRALAGLDPGLCPEGWQHLAEYRQGLDGLGARIQRSRVVVLAGSAKKR